MEAGSTKVRLDGLDKRVDDLGTQLREQRQEMKAGFEQVDKRFEKVDEHFETIAEQMRADLRLTLFGIGGAVVTIIAAMVGIPHI